MEWYIYNFYNIRFIHVFIIVFNEDTLYSAYEKRCKDIPFYKEIYEKQMQKEGEVFNPKEEMVQNLVDDLEKQLFRKLFIKISC